MYKNIKHFISTIIAAVLYFLFQGEQMVKDKGYISPKCIELSSSNFSNLLKGEWTVITFQNQDNAPDIVGLGIRNIAILNINSLEKAELAARLGITDPKPKAFIKNGEFISQNKK